MSEHGSRPPLRGTKHQIRARHMNPSSLLLMYCHFMASAASIPASTSCLSRGTLPGKTVTLSATGLLGRNVYVSSPIGHRVSIHLVVDTAGWLEKNDATWDALLRWCCCAEYLGWSWLRGCTEMNGVGRRATFTAATSTTAGAASEAIAASSCAACCDARMHSCRL